MKTYSIYTLSDHRDGRVRYVGCTSQAPKVRLAGHLYGAKSGRERSRRADWLRRLLQDGVTPTMTIVESVDDGQWETAERRWIAEYRRNGADLTNESDGGAGLPGYNMPPDQRAELSARTSARQRGMKRSAEARANMSQAQRNMDPETRARVNNNIRNISPEARERSRTSNIGRKATAEARANMSAAHQNVSEETRQKLRQAVLERTEEQRRAFAQSSKGRKRSAETRERMSLAAKARWERERAAKEQDRGS